MEHLLSLAYVVEEERGPLPEAELVRGITSQLRRDAWESRKTRREELLLLAEFVEREVFLKHALDLSRKRRTPSEILREFIGLCENGPCALRERRSRLAQRERCECRSKSNASRGKRRRRDAGRYNKQNIGDELPIIRSRV